MARMTGPHMDAILARHGASPAVFVETGTFHGGTTRLAVPRFREVHTIELHPVWFVNALRDLGPLGVRCHPGNSADLIPYLAQNITEPVTWFLDAHYFHRKVKGVAGKAEGLPLWAELDAIAKRPYADVVIVDDTHSFGTSEPTPEWLDVSLDRIASYFPSHREAAILGDQAVIYKAAL